MRNFWFLKKLIIVKIFFFVFLYVAEAQGVFTVDTVSYTPQQLVQEKLVTGCMQASNVQYNGSFQSIGYFENTGSAISFSNGIILSTGRAIDAVGPNNEMNISSAMSQGGDADLDSIVFPNTTEDAAILEFDFVPSSDSVWFRYVFASDEYPEYVCDYNDVFGFFMSGPGITGDYENGAINIARIPGTQTPVSINTVNNGNPADTIACPPVNVQYYVDNGMGITPLVNTELQYDGYTIELVASLSVQACQTYHIKLAIGDAVSDAYDSAVLLEAGSFSSGSLMGMDFQTLGQSSDQVNEGCEGDFIFSRGASSDLSSDLQFDLTFSGNAVNGVDYSWTPPAFVIPAGDSVLNIPIDFILDGVSEGVDTLVYLMETNDVCDCSSVTITIQDTIFIFDRDSLQAQINQIDTLICYPDSILLDVSSNYSEGLQYNWSTGSTDSSVWVTALQDTVFYVSVQDICGQTVTDSVVVGANSYVVFNSVDLEQDACFGDSLGILFEVTGTEPYTLQWFGPGGLIASEENDTLILNNIQLSQDGNYWLQGSNMCGISNSDTAIIHVTDVPQISIQPVDVNACVGDSAGLIVATDVYTGYQWYNNDGLILGATNDSLIFDSIAFNAMGDYYCIASNACGADTTDTVIVMVNPLPVVMFLDLTDHCENDTAFEVYGGVPAGGIYTGLGIDGNNFMHPDIAGYGEHLVTYTYAAPTGCVDTAMQYITIDSVPEVQFADLPDICLNADAIYLYGGTPAGGLYVVDYSDTTSSFNPENYGVGAHDMVYTYTAFNGCSNTDTASIFVNDLPVVTFDSIGIFCETYPQFTLNEGSPSGGNYIGYGVIDSTYFSPDSAGVGTSEIIYYYTDANQCTSSDTQYVEVLDGPLVVFEDSSALCSGSSDGALYTSVYGGLSPYNYLWSNDSVTTANLTNVAPGWYTVTVTDTTGCSSVSQYEVGFIYEFNAYAGIDKSICHHDSTILSDSSYYADSALLTFSWSPLDSTISDSSALSPTVYPLETTTYTVTVSDSVCTAVDSATITVFQPMGIDAGEDLHLFTGESVDVYLSGGLMGATYVWSPADGLSSPLVENPTITAVLSPGVNETWYYVTAYSPDGCPEKDSLLVISQDFVIPKGFSPNGDGINDTWEIDYFKDIEGITVEIYNRWGTLLYKSEGLYEPWDGISNGEPVASGTYYYVFKIPSDIPAYFQRTGSVTIIR